MQPRFGAQSVSDIDEGIKLTKRFEKLRQEYLQWETKSYYILNLLRQIDDAGSIDRPQREQHKTPGDLLRPSGASESTLAAKDWPAVSLLDNS